MVNLDFNLINEIKQELLSNFNSSSNSEIDNLNKLVMTMVNKKLCAKNLSLRERNHYIKYIINSIRGMDILQPLMEDSHITEIMVNSKNAIFIEKNGQLLKTDLEFNSQEHLENVITGIFARANKDLSLTHPITDLRLYDGSRANAVLAPIAPNGPVLTIRKFTGILPTPEQIIASKTISREAMDFLAEQIRNKQSIFICGGTAAGKTTLLNALSTFIPTQERIITIEDSAELQLRNQPNLVKLEARPSNSSGQGEVSIADLIKTALRMRPDRIIVGEVRGDEAYMLIHAANTGHPGTLCTGHGNSSPDMLIRLSNMISGCTRLPYPAILRNLVTSLNYIINIKRLSNGQRRIIDISKILSNDDKKIIIEAIFKYNESRDKLEKIK